MRPIVVSIVALILLTGCNAGSTVPAGPSQASVFTEHDAVGQFYQDYTGPKRASLNAINAGGRLLTGSQNFVLDAQMAGPIVSGDTNYYVWGVQRGSAVTAPFADEPNVLFDAVIAVTVTPSGTVSGTVNLLNGQPAQSVTATLTAADTIRVTVPVAALPTTTGTQPADYRWNLWPRSGVGGAAADQIASFIPENGIAPFTSVQQ